MKLKTSEDHQQIGELSRSLGVTTRTLRLYEQMGLIDPPQRTEGGSGSTRRTTSAGSNSS